MVTVERRSRLSVLPATLLSASGFVLFALENRVVGFSMLAVALLGAAFVNRSLAKDLALIAFGLTVMSLVPITTDISTGHMLEMGTAMIAAVGVPYAVSRWVYREHAVRFPVLTGQKWTRAEKVYLWVVPPLGYVMLAYYMMSTGVYQNWPAVSEPDGIIRLFIGTNGLGIWDELFFICTAFTLLRRHLPEWQANLLQAVLFTSFLWELGFEAWGPVFIFPFALLQARLFTVTKSLAYIVSVHLLFDFMLFLVLLQAHNSGWWDAFGF
ncbi:CPBP family intramembrane glutamic endopeptidase [Pseudarthrobacter sp. J75]|uniref:CPBP family intramembrane glutamic endopeptidase n=1 Tax=unclassified Pseudarthrobacter TaxID=2647000 RepID=UPI002E804B48|nr:MULTISPECIES: CPBP family intramembrane glutamic endopeptidase [unclassified Pseudarthrobacter]MEE2523470.1 CPBP family intramembrane glutamic endopeptidase [Pseudarthrobacter sp. J47]MEE2530445.1 CPBP family intramembrane glutamic endopeptidase [Pseudarthrobacter sp. J75]MEE2570157.1 CPBP family intramembrane glutamic endopeptidase [Pseudarthrobacter sp. J64]